MVRLIVIKVNPENILRFVKTIKGFTDSIILDF